MHVSVYGGREGEGGMGRGERERGREINKFIRIISKFKPENAQKASISPSLLLQLHGRHLHIHYVSKWGIIPFYRW